MSGRAELLIPEGWKPARNVRVRVLAHRDDNAPPAGVWRIVDRSNGDPGPHWWAQPIDETARRWAEQHPGRITSGCVEVKGLRCVPPETQLEIPGATPAHPKRGRR